MANFVKNRAFVDLGSHIYEDHTYETREQFQRFCDDCGYRLVAFIEGVAEDDSFQK